MLSYCAYHGLASGIENTRYNSHSSPKLKTPFRTLLCVLCKLFTAIIAIVIIIACNRNKNVAIVVALAPVGQRFIHLMLQINTK